jgi:hypothetical protein
MFKYDPEHDPDPAKWLALDEATRIEFARRYHRRIRAELPNIRAHAAAHAIVENQLAEGLPEAKRALERLLGDGLDRHDAIASVLMEHIWNLSNKPQGPGDPNAPYLAALDKLTADSWRRSG